MKRLALTALRYAGWATLLALIGLGLLYWLTPAKGRPLPSSPLLWYFLAFVLVVGVILSLVLRHLIQRSQGRAIKPAKMYGFMEEVLRKDPTAARFHEAGVVCCEAGEWDRALDYLGRIRPEDGGLYRSARYHMLIACLESDRVELASEIQAELPPEALGSDERYNVALAYKKHHALERAKVLFLRLFLMDIGFRDVGKQLAEIEDLERSRAALPPRYQFLSGAVTDRYADLHVTAELPDRLECTALDRNLGRHVVLRVLKPEEATAERIDGFLAEARELAGRDERGILRVYDIRSDRLPYFSVEPFEGVPVGQAAALPLPVRASAAARALELAESLGPFPPDRLLVAGDGEVRLTAIAPAERETLYAALARMLAPGEAPAIVEHARSALGGLLQSGAGLAETRRAAENLRGALALDAAARRRAAFELVLEWLEKVHRHWIHALKSKFAVVRRFPREAGKALAIFRRPENITEVDRMLAGLEEDLLGRPEPPRGCPASLREVLERLSSVGATQVRDQVRALATADDERAAASLEELSGRFAELSGTIARLLEEHEVDLADVVEGSVRSSVYAPMIRFPQAGRAGWRLRVQDPRELAENLQTALDNALHNAFEANAKRVEVTLLRGEQGDRVGIRLDDDGEGLEPGVLERLSRERFSSKAEGAGTGLTTSMRLLERHGGTLELTNRSETRGASLLISLPGGV